MPVEFDQENSFNKTFNRTFAKSNSSKMSAYLIKKGYAKNEKRANMILLSVSFIFIIITVFVFKSAVFSSQKPLSDRDIEISKAVEEYKKTGISSTDFRRKISEDIQSGKIK